MSGNYFFRLAFLFLAFAFVNTTTGANTQLWNIQEKKASLFIQPEQDTITAKAKMALSAEVADTNFSFEKYENFLDRISDTSRYTVLPIEEFRKYHDTDKVVIGLRHDVDIDLDHAYIFSETESARGFRSTYYILHSASYYLNNPSDLSVHSDRILPILKTMQDDRHFEIGFHNDLVTLQAVFNIDPLVFLSNELSWLRSNGINVTGTASHGSSYCKTYKYLNYYIFEECTWPVTAPYVNNISIPVGNRLIKIKKGKLNDFGFNYEAYFLDNNKYYSDASLNNGIRWNTGMLDLNTLKAGDRVIILTHPIHWHRSSTDTKIISFYINGQLSSEIDTVTRTINVRMPFGSDRRQLTATFVLAPAACARINGNLQNSSVTSNDYRNPVNFVVYAEKRSVKENWTINVANVRNSETDIEAFWIPGFTGRINIDHREKKITALLSGDVDLSQLMVKFSVSEGAHLFDGNNEAIENGGSFDFTQTRIFKIVAEDNINSSLWSVSIKRSSEVPEENDNAVIKMNIYPNPSGGVVTISLTNVEKTPSMLDIYDSKGVKVTSRQILKTGNFDIDVDLSKYSEGVYYFKYSLLEKPRVVVLHKK